MTRRTAWAAGEQSDSFYCQVALLPAIYPTRLLRGPKASFLWGGGEGEGKPAKKLHREHAEAARRVEAVGVTVLHHLEAQLGLDALDPARE